MPLVIVTRDPNTMNDAQALKLGPDLATIVAEALNAPNDEGGALTAKDIEVRFRDIGPLDLNASPLEIEVFANDYPSRKANLEDRVDRICRELRIHPSVPTCAIDDKGGFVWVFLGAAAFGLL